ncbi:MAG: hypothetical protein K6B67_03235 [Lachnospiraceae bacterium]|nr:hypothetical protein [Lachnospiraceae bacterium]
MGRTYVAKEQTEMHGVFPRCYLFTLYDDGTFILCSDSWYKMSLSKIEREAWGGTGEDARDTAEISYYIGHYEVNGSGYTLYYDEGITCVYDNPNDLYNMIPDDIEMKQDEQKHFSYQREIKFTNSKYRFEETIPGVKTFIFNITGTCDWDLKQEYEKLKNGQ